MGHTVVMGQPDVIESPYPPGTEAQVIFTDADGAVVAAGPAETTMPPREAKRGEILAVLPSGDISSTIFTLH